MTAIADEGARQRFARELDRNFSVIASAGSGKTRAITDRIVDIARHLTTDDVELLGLGGSWDDEHQREERGDQESDAAGDHSTSGESSTVGAMRGRTDRVA